jgi:hypothetical protein
MHPWLKLTPAKFEEFCYRILEANNFKSLQWYGKGGGDRGRDILCTNSESVLDGVEETRSWLVQCKHYKKAKVTKRVLSEWIAACREHKPDCLLLITSATLSSDVKDWLRSIRSEYAFRIFVWEEIDIRKQYVKHAAKLRAHFPEFGKVGKQVSCYEINIGYTH